MRMARSLVLAIMLGILNLFLLTVATAATPPNPGVKASIDDLQAATHGAARITVDDATGVARFIGFPRGLASFHLQGDKTSVAANDFFETYGSAFGIRDAAAELSLKSSKIDTLGYTHITKTQVHEGVPVFAAELKTHFARDGSLSAVNGVFIPGIKAGSTPALNAAEAALIAIAHVADQQKKRLPINHRGTQLEAIGTTLTYYHTVAIPGTVYLIQTLEFNLYFDWPPNRR